MLWTTSPEYLEKMRSLAIGVHRKASFSCLLLSNAWLEAVFIAVPEIFFFFPSCVCVHLLYAFFPLCPDLELFQRFFSIRL